MNHKKLHKSMLLLQLQNSKRELEMMAKYYTKFTKTMCEVFECVGDGERIYDASFIKDEAIIRMEQYMKKAESKRSLMEKYMKEELSNEK